MPPARSRRVGWKSRSLVASTNSSPLCQFFIDFTVATKRHRLRQLLVHPHANVASGLELTRCLPWEPPRHEIFMNGSTSAETSKLRTRATSMDLRWAERRGKVAERRLAVRAGCVGHTSCEWRWECNPTRVQTCIKVIDPSRRTALAQCGILPLGTSSAQRRVYPELSGLLKKSSLVWSATDTAVCQPGYR